jgi:hypothetical protein
MWTSRNIVALGLFLSGMTCLWLAAAMAGRAPAPSGTACTLTNVFAYVAVIGSAVAAWGVFKQYSWGRRPRLCPASPGWLLSSRSSPGRASSMPGFADFGVQIHLWMHILGSAAVLGIVLVPVAHDGVTRCL